MTRALARDILAGNISRLCTERGVDPAALAEGLGWAPAKLETAMTGVSDIDLDDLSLLAATLQVPAHVLLTAPRIA